MTSLQRVLVIDDDGPGSRLVKALFAGEGCEVLLAEDGDVGLARAAADRPDLVLLDLHLPTIDGMEVLERLKRSQPELPIIMLTAHTDVRAAIRAIQLGAFDYVTKPAEHEELLLVARRALETRALRREVDELRRKVADGGALAEHMGPSTAIRRIIEQVATVAASDFTVLVLGETGCGKELVSQAIHRNSERRDAPFVALDCGAIPETLLESELFGHEKGAFTGADRRKEGRFTLAEGGTLFLDEVGNLPMSLQAKLLRVLESKQVQPVGGTKTSTMDVRFVAATNNDLQAQVSAGRFRADLYFRLAQYTISLPSLRDRPDDIPYLAQRFLGEVSVELRRPVQRVPADVVALLQRHAWPGNVRELRNVIRQAVLETREMDLSVDQVQRLLGSRPGEAHAMARTDGRSLKQIADEAARAAERHAISEVLRTTRGNKSQAARALQTDYKTLHLKMKNLGIRARDFSG